MVGDVKVVAAGEVLSRPVMSSVSAMCLSDPDNGSRWIIVVAVKLAAMRMASYLQSLVESISF